MTPIEHKRHTLAHLLATVVLEHDPSAKLGIGPTIENGFYYDFQLTKPITDADLPKLTEEMQKLVKKGLEMKGKEVTADEARTMFASQPFKVELIDEYAGEGKTLTAYTIGGFTDLCKGGHADSTKDIDPDSFVLQRVAGAYWRGDSTKQMLTRVYGLAFETKAELEAYLKQLEDAKNRDHRKIGKEQDLFVFSELVGPGLPLWTPKGTLLRDALDGYVWELRKKAGYERVDIPHITKKDLYEKSGHWEKFRDELFRVNTREGHEFALKPMNCPHHTQIYDRHPHSYKELPIRYANTTKVYRDEQTGELGGLTRVRAITQDDAHVFCRTSQIAEELNTIWDIIQTFYTKFGFALRVRLSLHDPNHFEKYLGTPEIWKTAEQTLRDVANARGEKAEEAIGEAALYGPKLDFMATDSLGRTWQVATAQLDMNMPERFDLTCVNESGAKERIVMIHAAIMGSLERFIAVLLEHTGGALPAWASPIQVAVLTVSDKVTEYGIKVSEELSAAGVRAVLDAGNESIGKKIRAWQMQKVPYMLVLGPKEAESGMVSVRSREKGDEGTMSVANVISSVQTSA